MFLLVLAGIAVSVPANAQDEIGTYHWNLSEQHFQLLDDELTYYLFSEQDFRTLLQQSAYSHAYANNENLTASQFASPPFANHQDVQPASSQGQQDSKIALASYETFDEVDSTDDSTGISSESEEDTLLGELLPPMEILAFEWPGVSHGKSILASNTVAELQAVVDQERMSVEEDTHNTESQRAARLQQLSAADEWLQKASQYQRRIRLYSQQTAESNESKEEKRRLLSQPIEPASPPDAGVDSATLYRDLQDKRAQLAARKIEFEQDLSLIHI